MKQSLVIGICSLSLGIVFANDGWNKEALVYKNGVLPNPYHPTKPTSYRIPAITTTPQGTVITAVDMRYVGKHGNTDIVAGASKVNPVKFSIRVSNDLASSWSEEQIISPSIGNQYITDPAIVSDWKSGKTFLFGYQNTKHLTKPGGDAKFMVFVSSDGGYSWDQGKELDIKLGEGYHYTLQGPGSGMYYNAGVYIGVQGWGSNPSVSGYIYSKDGGKTWNTASLAGKLPKGVSVSESNVFYHKGKIALGMKVESGNLGMNRVVYATGDDGKTWERLREDFLPQKGGHQVIYYNDQTHQIEKMNKSSEVAKAESSSLSLNDDVYLVGYSLQGRASWDRTDVFLATNTGRTIKLFSGEVKGYTSLAQDGDNLYILFEGNNLQNHQDEGNIYLRRFDISGKEYANINGQILQRGYEMLELQDKLLQNSSFISGEYSQDDANKVDLLLVLDGFKFGAFYQKIKDNSKYAPRTIDYDLQMLDFMLVKSGILTSKEDDFHIGLQYLQTQYKNTSKITTNSFSIGYVIKPDWKILDYKFALNWIYGENFLQRNYQEGLGKTADFSSYAFAIRNELGKEISFASWIECNMALGLDSVSFSHSEIVEKNGNTFNDMSVDKNLQFSNEIFAKFGLKIKIPLWFKGVEFSVGGEGEYKKELMDVEQWRDTLRVLDTTRDLAVPVLNAPNGILEGRFSALFNMGQNFYIDASYMLDTIGEKNAQAKLFYQF